MSAVVELETKAERAKTVHFLDLKETSCLPFKTKLPTAREVFCTFLYRHLTLRETIYDAASAVTKEVREIYEFARLPLQDNSDIIRKIQTMNKNYGRIKKNKSRKTETQRNLEQGFLKELEKLFVVVKSDWKNADPTPLPEDIEFYEKQLLPGKLVLKSLVCLRGGSVFLLLFYCEFWCGDYILIAYGLEGFDFLTTSSMCGGGGVNLEKKLLRINLLISFVRQWIFLVFFSFSFVDSFL